jgi:subtilisin family serine protease
MVALAQPRRPDLTVVSTRIEGGRVTATIANRGALAPTVRATTTLFAGGKSFDVVTPALLPGTTSDVTFDTVLSAGTTYQVVVDSGRVVDEADETNNRTLNQIVPGQARPRGVTVDPALTREARAHRLPPLADGQPRATAVARFPRGEIVPFAENELLLTTKDIAQATAVAARWGGKVVKVMRRPAATGRGSTFLIRVDTAKAPQTAFTAREDGFVFSSDAARNLLAIAATERKNGVPVGINLISRPAGLFEQKTREANGANALAFDYMQAGGALDVDVAEAWKALFQAGKTAKKSILIGIVDCGFALGTSSFNEPDLDAAVLDGTSKPNQTSCGASPCPWHGHQVAEAAAGVADNNSGAAGPAGPVARIVAIDAGGYSMASTVPAMWRAFENGARIINMSFTGKYPRDEGWFSSAFPEALEDFEKDTVWLNDSGGVLLFAGAGNNGEDIDARNGEGNEATWYAPCENQGVICVGGWIGAADSKFPGQTPDAGSNFSSGNGEVVDIFGPMTVNVSDVPGDTNPVNPVSGTSVASPFVAGVAALIWAGNPSLTSAQVWGLMEKHAIVVVSPTFRRVHAFRAVREAILSSGVNNAPAVQISLGGPVGQMKTKLSAVAYDIEDSNCCKASWTIDDQPAGSGLTVDHDFGKDNLGPKVIKVTVTDNGGKTGSASTTVTLGNKAPTVKLTKVPQQTLSENEPFPFRSEVFDDTIALDLPDHEACPKVSGSSARRWWATDATLRSRSRRRGRSPSSRPTPTHTVRPEPLRPG